MKNYTITQDQIKKLSTQNQIVEEYLNEWFPEAFKHKLEIGKWYISNDMPNHIFYVTKITEDKYYYYGFNTGGQWSKNDCYSFNDTGLKYGFRLSTEEEIRNALINEAKKRGYKNKNTKSLKLNSKFCKIDKNYDFVLFLTNETTLYSQPKGKGGFCLFENGIWAEIKENVTLNYQQIADKFGIDVEQLRITKV